MRLSRLRTSFSSLLFFSIISACSEAANEEKSPADGANPPINLQTQIAESSITELGRLIFEDKRLSEPQGVSCSSCHLRQLAFTGNNNSSIPAVAAGAVRGTFGSRNSPTVLYAQFSPRFGFISQNRGNGPVLVPVGGQFWDGRAANLIEQAKEPFLGALEMNNPSKQRVIDKIRSGPYANQFRLVFGENVFNDTEAAFNRVAEAIASAESTVALAPFNSKFDGVLRGRERFTELEKWGFAVFSDPNKGNCIACHAVQQNSNNPRDWLFTNHTYENIGIPRNNDIPANRNPDFFDLGLCAQRNLKSKSPAGFDAEAFCGSFKVPTLRNVAVTGPYMHNGIFTSLETVVAFYATRDTNPELWYPVYDNGEVCKFDDLPERYRGNVNTFIAPYDRQRGEEPRFNREEGDALVAFLKTLTDR